MGFVIYTGFGGVGGCLMAYVSAWGFGYNLEESKPSETQTDGVSFSFGGRVYLFVFGGGIEFVWLFCS